MLTVSDLDTFVKAVEQFSKAKVKRQDGFIGINYDSDSNTYTVEVRSNDRGKTRTGLGSTCLERSAVGRSLNDALNAAAKEWLQYSLANMAYTDKMASLTYELQSKS